MDEGRKEGCQGPNTGGANWKTTFNFLNTKIIKGAIDIIYDIHVFRRVWCVTAFADKLHSFCVHLAMFSSVF